MRPVIAVVLAIGVLLGLLARTARADRGGHAAPRAPIEAARADGVDEDAFEAADADAGADADTDAAPPDHSVVIAPPIGAVLAAAYAAAGLDRTPGRGLARRARLAGLVPWLSVRTGRNTSWRDDDPHIGRGVTLEVRATWRLDRLVFEPRELQVVSLEAARRRERRQLAGHVIETYFAWRRASAASAAGRLRSAPWADQAAAELDALTGQWFSEAVLAVRRAAAVLRTRRRTMVRP